MSKYEAELTPCAISGILGGILLNVAKFFLSFDSLWVKAVGVYFGLFGLLFCIPLIDLGLKWLRKLLRWF